MLSFRHASRRNTKAYVVTIGDVEAFISYETVVAVRSPRGFGRLENTWGPTTGRHLNEMGLRDWPIVDEAELRRLAQPCRHCDPEGVCSKCGEPAVAVYADGERACSSCETESDAGL